MGFCQKAGPIKLGNVELDGTKVRPNASKHEGMSYVEMEGEILQLEVEVSCLPVEAGSGGKKTQAIVASDVTQNPNRK